MSTTHTILLVQPSKKPEGRTYSDYESVNDCMEGVCRIYEEHLKKSNPSSSQITYDISQVSFVPYNVDAIFKHYEAFRLHRRAPRFGMFRLQGQLEIVPAVQSRVDQRENLLTVEEAGHWKVISCFQGMGSFATRLFTIFQFKAKQNP